MGDTRVPPNPDTRPGSSKVTAGSDAAAGCRTAVDLPKPAPGRVGGRGRSGFFGRPGLYDVKRQPPRLPLPQRADLELSGTAAARRIRLRLALSARRRPDHTGGGVRLSGESAPSSRPACRCTCTGSAACPSWRWRRERGTYRSRRSAAPCCRCVPPLLIDGPVAGVLDHPGAVIEVRGGAHAFARVFVAHEIRRLTVGVRGGLEDPALVLGVVAAPLDDGGAVPGLAATARAEGSTAGPCARRRWCTGPPWAGPTGANGQRRHRS